MIFDRFSQLKYKYGNRRFWSVGYYVSTVGLNEATIRKYIREQEHTGQMLDRMTIKEYTNLFRPKQGKLPLERLRVKYLLRAKRFCPWQ